MAELKVATLIAAQDGAFCKGNLVVRGHIHENFARKRQERRLVVQILVGKLADKVGMVLLHLRGHRRHVARPALARNAKIAGHKVSDFSPQKKQKKK